MKKQKTAKGKAKTEKKPSETTVKRLKKIEVEDLGQMSGGMMQDCTYSGYRQKQ